MVIKNSINSIAQSAGPDEDDAKSRGDSQVCMQLLKPESITHYELSFSKEMIKKD